jgi:hypothetical protein
MRLSVKSWNLRQAAARGLTAGDYDGAAAAAQGAEFISHTRRGAFLHTLAEWMKTAAH